MEKYHYIIYTLLPPICAFPLTSGMLINNDLHIILSELRKNAISASSNAGHRGKW